MTTTTAQPTPTTFAEPPLPVTLARARVRKPGQTVPSPCVGVCKMDATHGWCSGCFRTLEELRGWGEAPDTTKLAVWSRVEQRQGL